MQPSLSQAVELASHSGKLGTHTGFFFFTKKVTPRIGVFPSANFPQEKYFSPSNHLFPKKPILPTLIQSIVMRFSEWTLSQPERSAAKLAKMHVSLTFSVFNTSHQSSRFTKNRH